MAAEVECRALVAPVRPRDHAQVSGDLEAQRIRSAYRRLVLLGRARLPLGAARQLVGPDCAFHLYFRHAPEAPDTPRRKRRRARK